MKIVISSPGIYPYVLGGIQRHSFNLARHWARLGVKVDLYHTDFKKSKGIDNLAEMTAAEKQNITSIAIPWQQSDRLPGHYIRDLKQFSQQIYKIYQQRAQAQGKGADFIYGQSLTAWTFVNRKQAGEPLPPIGVNLHGYEMFQPSANTKTFLENKLLRPAFKQHARSADYVFSLGGKLTELIQNRLHISPASILEMNVGIDSTWIAPNVQPINQPRRFVFLGRYERRKGIEELQAVIQANPDWQKQAEFRFIGPIPNDKRLALPHVSYAGKIMDEALLQQELRSADVLLCPSHSEGMPTVILEAMASGLAIIATDVGAVQLMVNSDNGVLLPQVTVQGLSNAIESVVDMSADELLAMKRTSLKQVQAFQWNHIASKTLDFIHEMTAQQAA